jgi:hypothetical protein
MKLSVFPRDDSDPTSLNPPLFVKVGQFLCMPNRNEIDNCMGRAATLLDEASQRERREAEFAFDSIDKAASLVIRSYKEKDVDVKVFRFSPVLSSTLIDFLIS